MTGLEKILKAIEEEAMANADTVISKANQEAEEIIAAATSEAQKKCAEIATKSEADVNAANARAQSAAALQERKLMLEAKQQVISNVILNAKNTLLQLPVSEYFDVILRMVLKYSLKLTRNDYRRIFRRRFKLP
ncbi:MAG: hypothetical protein K0S47_3752 [Herbinix sp.]|nr:hypothetical protein [Herbinix sp.]